MKARLFAVGVLAIVSSLSFAWDAKGHQIIGEIAFRNLTPEAKSASLALIKSMNDERYKFFYQATVWADDIKKDTRDFDAWHYVNFYQGQENKKPEEPNALTAMKAQTAILKGAQYGQDDKRRALMWMLHLIGDIHMPLHSSSRIVNGESDRGGNGFTLDAKGQIRNLHYYWDSAMTRATTGLDIAASADKVLKTAEGVEGYPNRTKKATEEMTFEGWAKESFNLAKDYLYKTPEGRLPDAKYDRMAEEIACVRGTEAGLRLAKYLNDIFKK